MQKMILANFSIFFSPRIRRIITISQSIWSKTNKFVGQKMEVTDPKVVWVEGRCYRFCDSSAWAAKDLASTPYTEDLSAEDSSASFGLENTGKNSSAKTSKRERKKGAAKQGTTMNQPKRERPTHFIAIPIENETILRNFEKFKKDVLELPSDGAPLQKELFQKIPKMHLTLGVLVLPDSEAVQKANEALQECYEKLIKPFVDKSGPIAMRVQGVACLNSRPAKAYVLYGQITTENDALQELADSIVDFFVDKGLMTKDRKNVTLHLTLMNRKFLAGPRKQHGRFWTFDASAIIEAHSDYYFGEQILKTIQLCQMSEGKEFYPIASKVDLVE